MKYAVVENAVAIAAVRAWKVPVIKNRWSMNTLALRSGLVGWLFLPFGMIWAQEVTTSIRNTDVPVETKEQPTSYWMAKKLDFSKSILEALTMADFKKLEENAHKMRVLGKVEGFVRRKNEAYRTQLQTFDTANAELIRQAQRRSPEGALTAFNQLTSSCVACHVLLREGVD